MSCFLGKTVFCEFFCQYVWMACNSSFPINFYPCPVLVKENMFCEALKTPWNSCFSACLSGQKFVQMSWKDALVYFFERENRLLQSSELHAWYDIIWKILIYFTSWSNPLPWPVLHPGPTSVPWDQLWFFIPTFLSSSLLTWPDTRWSTQAQEHLVTHVLIGLPWVWSLVWSGSFLLITAICFFHDELRQKDVLMWKQM